MINIFKYHPQRGFQHSDRVETGLLEISPDDLLWVDLEDATSDEEDILKTYFKFHPLALEDTFIEVQYPKVDLYPGYIFVVLHGINYLAATKEFTTAEINVFLGHQFLITYHGHQMRSVRYTMDRIRQEPEILGSGLDRTLYSILDRMVDNYFPELEKLEDRIEELEEEIFAEPSQATLQKVFKLKHDLMHLKRIVYPQREVFNRLSRDEIPSIQPATRLYFRDTYDSLFRMTDTADNYRDLLTGLLDAYLSAVSIGLNETMKVLTVIATICIPMTVIAGVYGMNFQYMPELNWEYGYWFALSLMMAVGVGMLWYFRKKKWI